MKSYKNIYLQAFSLVIILLSVVRLVFVDGRTTADGNGHGREAASVETTAGSVPATTAVTPHPVYSVSDYATAFPDTNGLQLVYARQWGTTPVVDRAEAETRKADLVYIGSNPYYHVAPLGQSIPYLVPHAATLLHDIGRAYYDSLFVKGIPLHQLVVTSVLRSEADVRKLRLRNPNATENSCHRYGTTFDISYVRFKTVEDPDGPSRRTVSNDTLKRVLSEVLNDMRHQQRCCVKYERRQPCFHITVR